jgi:hypothetical protein
MARLLAFDAVFFLVPFVVYAAWLFSTRGNVGGAADWPMRTIGYLAIGGAAVMLLALVVFISFQSGAPGKHYVPAKTENGVIVPGHFE